MAGLTFEDTEKALRLYFSGLLADDVPKPQHRDGRIVLFTPKGRRRLEGVTVEMVQSALTYIRILSELDHTLLVDRYKHEINFEIMMDIHLISEAEIAERIGKALKKVADHILLEDGEDASAAR